jgi:hypothetical protein
MIMMNGIDPRMSITENKISVTEKISFRSTIAKFCSKAKTKMPDLRPALGSSPEPEPKRTPGIVALPGLLLKLLLNPDLALRTPAGFDSQL